MTSHPERPSMSNDALRMAFWKRWFDMVHEQPLLGPMFNEAISAMKSLESSRAPSDAGHDLNFLQVVTQSHIEKMTMYMKMSKKDLAEMLINANTLLEAKSGIITTPTPKEPHE